MDDHPQTQATNSEIAAYATLIRIRKKWALRNIIAVGIVSVVSFSAVIGLTWAFRDRAISSTTTLVVAQLVVFPYVGLVNLVAEYRRLNGILELLDVLERATSKGEPEDRDT